MHVVCYICIPVVRSDTGFVIPAPEHQETSSLALETPFAVSEYLKFSYHIFILTNKQYVRMFRLASTAVYTAVSGYTAYRV
jgi:hypothetical protein